MTMKVRALLVAVVLLAEMSLVGCGHYTCGTTFGSGSCSGGSTGISNNGTGTTTSGIYVLIANAGGIQGEVVDPTAKTFAITPGFGTVPVNTNVPGDWMVIAGGKFMYSGYTSIGQIYGWTVNQNGTLTALTTLSGGQTQSAPYLINAFGGTQFMISNPAGTLLFVGDTDSDQVHVYQIGTNGGLTEVIPAIQLPSGFGLFNLAVDGAGKYLYASNVLSLQTTEVAEYSIGSNGVLTAVGAPVLSNLQQMQGEASGKFMIGTSGGIFGTPGNLYIASIDQSTGALTPTQVTTTGQPINLAVQRNIGGTLVYTIDDPTTGLNGPLEGFTLDSTAGVLTPIQMANQSGYIGEFDATGQYLFVSSNPNQAHIGLNVFDVSADSSLTAPLAGVAWAQGAWMPFNTQ